MGGVFLSMCRLSVLSELRSELLSNGWRLGVFGSAAFCPGETACTVGVSDVDLVVVHPPGSERDASIARRRLIEELDAKGLVADVVVLSTLEIESSDFWDQEGAVGLATFVDGCTTRQRTRES